MLERELALELGLRELYQSGAMLSRKEHDVINTTKALESKQLSIRSAEDNALFQRISAAAIHREAHRLRSSGPSVVSARNRLEQITSNGPPGNQLPSQHIKIVAEVERDKELEDELRSIQRSIRSSKHTLDKNANARNATFGFLTQEVNYISSSGYY